MSDTSNLAAFIDACSANGLECPALQPCVMFPGAHEINIPVGQWRDLIQAAKQAAMRWCAFWGQERHLGLEVCTVLEHKGTYLIFRCLLGADESLPSMTPASSLSTPLSA